MYIGMEAAVWARAMGESVDIVQIISGLHGVNFFYVFEINKKSSTNKKKDVILQRSIEEKYFYIALICKLLIKTNTL